MATVKCKNPQCDYFQKPVPEGEFCPFCGEPLGISNPVIDTPSQPLQPTTQPFEPFDTPDRSFSSPPPPISSPTIVEPKARLKDNKPFFSLIHNSGSNFPIYEKNPYKKFYLGRRGGTKMPQPDIDLTDIPHSDRVSRPHAHIVWDSQANSYMFVDENSTNGSILNGKPLEPFQPYRLNHGDRLELGREHMVIFTVELNKR